MQDYLEFFTANPNGVLATIDDGAIKTRIFQFLWGDEGRIFFCTSKKKEVYAQLRKNPQAAFCAFDGRNYANVGVSGRAVFIEDGAAKKRALDENPGIKAIYHSPDNPDFEIFYLDLDSVDSFDFQAGKRSRRIKALSR